MKEDTKLEESAITVSSSEPPEECLRVENNGDVFWRKNGVMTKVDMDSELAQAFAYCVVVLAKQDATKLIEAIKGNKVRL